MTNSTNLIRQPNSFNTIRLLAAMQVLFGHLTVQYDFAQELTPVTGILSLFPGVSIFFMLSGFLIWNSIEHSGSYRQYLTKRILRIYPELWISVVLEAILLLIFLPDRIPLLEFALFLFGQATVFQFWKPDFIRSFGCGTPNGSLWTIPVMALFYLVAWWYHKLLHGRKKSLWAIHIAAAMIIGVLARNSAGILPDVLYKLLRYSLIPHFWLFLIAMFLAENVEKVLPFLKKYWLFFVSAALIFRACSIEIEIGYFDVFEAVFLFSGWLGFAYRYPMMNIKRDISYGIYLFHMLVVNTILTVRGNACGWPAVGMTIVISCILAWASSHMAEFWNRHLKCEAIATQRVKHHQ